MSRTLRTLLLSIALSDVGLVPASAVDGVIEISQSRAIAGGVTVGDSAGFPVTLSATASYRLTSNLTVSDESLDAIAVTAADVTLDLNGFSIVGPTICTGTPPAQAVACAPENGSAAGIDATGVAGLTVANGTLRGHPWAGVSCGSRCRLRDLRVVTNGRDGVLIGSGGVVESIQVDRNGDWGIRAPATANGVAVRRSVVMFNGDGGIALNSAALVEGSVVRNNGGNGVVATQGRLAGNAVTGNGQSGIVINGGVVLGNLTGTNTTWGINLTGSVVGLGGNAATEPPSNDIAGVWVELAGNLCSNALCP